VTQKILLVDSDPAALSCYRQMLEGEFDIATAASGEEGLALLRAHGPFAVVISDMQMTGMDGAQFLKRVRYVASGTITLLLTGHLDLHGAASAVNAMLFGKTLIAAPS
jgi:DNA-binding NtrC family response regulator